MNSEELVKLENLIKLETGKLDSNYANEKGIYPFFTCAPTPLKIDTYSYDKKAILLAGNNANGNFHINYYEGKFDAYQRTYIIEVKNEEILNIKFLYYYLKICLNNFKHFSQGTSTKFLTKKIINNFKIRLPPLDFQLKCINILKIIDKEITTIKKINKNLEQLAKLIYNYLYIDFKLLNNVKFIDSKIGKIPENWKIMTINEFVKSIMNGGTPKRKESRYWNNGKIPWLKTGEINNNLILDSEEFITEEGLINSSAKLLPINTVIIALYGKGTAARVGLLKTEATTNQACCAMICESYIKSVYLYLFLLNKQKQIEQIANGSVQQNLNKKIIGNLPIIVPPDNLLNYPIFTKIYDVIYNNLKEIKSLEKLRDTLLPKLMSGEIDISQVEL